MYIADCVLINLCLPETGTLLRLSSVLGYLGCLFSLSHFSSAFFSSLHMALLARDVGSLTCKE